MLEEGSHGFEVKAKTGRRKGLWWLTLEPEAMALRYDKTGDEYRINKAEAAEKIELVGVISERILAAQIPKKEVFELNAEQIALVKEWLGPPTMKELRIALKKWLKWCLPVGIMFVLLSIPMSGNPDAEIEPIPFDPISAFLGVMLIGISIAIRWWPRPELFLVASAWFFVGGIKIIYDIVKGSSWLWGILAFLLLLSVLDAWRQYRRFALVKKEERPDEDVFRAE